VGDPASARRTSDPIAPAHADPGEGIAQPVRCARSVLKSVVVARPLRPPDERDAPRRLVRPPVRGRLRDVEPGGIAQRKRSTISA
jgi:hypothetical protein